MMSAVPSKALHARLGREDCNKNVTLKVRHDTAPCVVNGDFNILQFCQKNDSEKLG
jgi:hypothetical protein